MAEARRDANPCCASRCHPRPLIRMFAHFASTRTSPGMSVGYPGGGLSQRRVSLTHHANVPMKYRWAMTVQACITSRMPPPGTGAGVRTGNGTSAWREEGSRR
jgi:hypothetical protein